MRGGSRGHKEDATDFGAPAVDGAFAGKLAAVVVEGRDSRQGDELVTAEGGDLRELRQQGPSGDVADAFDRGDDEAVFFEVRGAVDQGADVLFDEGHFLFQRLHVAAQGGQQRLGESFLDAVLLPGKELAELAAAIEQIGEFALAGGGSRSDPQGFAPGKAIDHLGINRVGLGFDPLASGKGAQKPWVDDAQGDFALVEELGQSPLVASGCFEDNQQAGLLRNLPQQGLEAFGRVLQREGGFVGSHLQGVFGDIDGDESLCVLGRCGSGLIVHGLSPACRGELSGDESSGLLQLSEIKPGSFRRSVLQHELGVTRFQPRLDLSGSARRLTAVGLRVPGTLPTSARREEISGKICGLRPEFEQRP